MKPYVNDSALSEVVFDKIDSKHCARKKSRKKSGLYQTRQWIKSAKRRRDKQRLKQIDYDEV